MGKGSGFGKSIFFGEHFVIYGVPGIVAALQQTANATVTKMEEGGFQIEDRRAGAGGYTDSKKAQQRESFERTARFLGLDSPSMDILLEGNLPAFSGIGASGASCVAIIRAISEEYDLKLTNEQVNTAAHEAEKAYHGEKTAGLDNVASTFGGFIYFTQVRPLKFTQLNISRPIDIVMADTGIVADTKDMIEGVARRYQNNRKDYERLFAEATEVTQEAKVALEKVDLPKVGQLMNANHCLLQEIEVTCPELDQLTTIALDHGALGAKQTGGGGGGCILALTPGKSLQDKVAQAIEKIGFSVLKTRVGG